MASLISKNVHLGSRIVQMNIVRSLTVQEQNKGPMDYVKQGVDQLNQAATKVKEVVVNAVTGDQTSSKTDSKQCDDSFNKKTDDLSHKYDQKGVKSNASKFGNAEEQTTTSKIVDKASNIFSEAKDTIKSTKENLQDHSARFADKMHQMSNDLNNSSDQLKNSTDRKVEKTRDSVKNTVDQAANRIKSIY